MWDTAHGWARNEDGVVACVLCGAVKTPDTQTDQRIPILLTREHWLITQMILKAAGDSWRRQVGGPGAQTNYDDIAEDIAAQLRAQGAEDE